MLDATAEPVERTRVLNGVVVPGTGFEDQQDNYPDHEEAVVAAFRRRVRRGDTVVVVGGGWGTTTVVAARMTHFEGRVRTYEPSAKMRRLLQRTVEVNRVGEVVTVDPAAVGSISDSSRDLFGPPDDRTVAPSDLPDCDVLDLDCEGAELDILRGIDFEPRLVTVEAHPHLGCSREAVEAQLRSQGYEIVRKAPIRSGSDITNYVAVTESAAATK